MKNSLKEFFTGFNSLVTGMRITLGQFFKPTVTVHYPHETLPIPPRFRGHIELVRDPDTGKAICFACKLCERACPSDCITVEGAKLDGAKKKSVTQYRLDFTKCSLCGSCVEACRDGAIRFSREYNLAGWSKEEFVMDLFKRLETEREQAERPEAASGKNEPAPAETPKLQPGMTKSEAGSAKGEGRGTAGAEPPKPEAPKAPAEPPPSGKTEGPK